jgi:hypothetical protein
MIVRHGVIRQKPMQGEWKGRLHRTSNIAVCQHAQYLTKPGQNSEQMRDKQSLGSKNDMITANDTSYLLLVI